MTPIPDPKTITILDPRTFDGDPFTVAQRAAEQVQALTKLALEQASVAEIMHRNSWMEAILQSGGELTPEGWDQSPYGRRWSALANDLLAMDRTLSTLSRAAGYDPKHPPKA